MRRQSAQLADMPGQDSFLDIVANMVGILIILVMVVGVRAGQAPVEVQDDSPALADSHPAASVAAPPDVPAGGDRVAAQAEQPAQQVKVAEEQLALARAHSENVRSEILHLDRQAKLLAREIEEKEFERTRLATVLEAVRRDIEDQRSGMDQASRSEFDTQLALDTLRKKLDQLRKQKAAIEARPAQVVEVQNLPTPLSQPVFNQQEVHFHLKGGRITFVPFDELKDAFIDAAREDVQEAPNHPGARLVKTIDPIRGFALRYELRMVNTSGGGTRVVPVRWELIPAAETLGEPVEVALGPGSRLHSILQSLPETRGSITIWAYEDSFADLRRIKAELHALGYPTAVWPRKMDQFITASPYGEKSAAQ